MSIVIRRPPRPSGGSCASFNAMPAWNGFVGPNALPTAAAPALIATTVTASTPMPMPSVISTGISGMISSSMFSRAPIAPKNMQTIGMTHKPRPANASTSHPTMAGSVPRRSTTTHAPPTSSTRTMMSAPAMNPRGTETTAANGPTGAALVTR